MLAEVAIPDGAITWTWFGWIAVEIVFVVLGYVISAAAEGATPIGIPGGRALRLVPVAWICATTTPAVAAVVCACRFAAIRGDGGPRHLSPYLIHQLAGAVAIARLCRLGLPDVTAALGLGFAVMRSRSTPKKWLRDRLRRITPIRGLAPDTLRTASPPIG